ncbi:MAG TPA: glycerophosphodiester phosphodiesterase family protein [Gammaproteobacteria bacterium]|nr:hypothetical protein [Xanthomonadales bacterium]MCB1604534.1 hypothetical protein [Xanthomonadales bacterium]HPQ87124.1 glycerophosphodiester phosphodiesterase family protein [Gammaproteobacteria bacterium]
MKKPTRIIIVSIIIFLLAFIIFNRFFDVKPIRKPLFIAHAGGGINGLIYLNSLEAINHNYEFGLRYFEMDFNWTSDNELVLIHDWSRTYQRLFGKSSKEPPTLKEFMTFEMSFSQTQLSLNQFANWMENHPDAILVADIKKNNLEGLKKIIKTIKNPYQRIIPQMYKLEEYQQIINLGFNKKNIMFAMYKTLELNSDIVEFLKTKELYAISVQPKKEYFETLLKQFGFRDLTIYTLTLNNPEEFQKLVNEGVDGTVTDYMYLSDNKILSHRNQVLN